MKLQLNNTGAWKNVTAFEPAEEEAVREAAERIGRAAREVRSAQVAWRLVDDLDVVTAHWTAQRGWVNKTH